MKETIIEYIRDNHNQPVGCFVARKFDDTIFIGWSKYAKNKESISFDKKTALSIAVGRLDKKLNHIIKSEKEVYDAIQTSLKTVKSKDLAVTVEIEHSGNSVHKRFTELPFLIQGKISKFGERCIRYFKSDTIIIC
jgi:hypothetical protein